MFLIFRIVIRGLALNQAILGSVASSSVSLILGLDVIAAVLIYFGPKFYNIWTKNSPSLKKSGLGGARESTTSQRRHDSNDNSGVDRLRQLGIVVIRSESRLSNSRNDSYSTKHNSFLRNVNAIEREDEMTPTTNAFPLSADTEASKGDGIERKDQTKENLSPVRQKRSWGDEGMASSLIKSECDEVDDIVSLETHNLIHGSALVGDHSLQDELSSSHLKEQDVIQDHDVD